MAEDEMPVNPETLRIQAQALALLTPEARATLDVIDEAAARATLAVNDEAALSDIRLLHERATRCLWAELEGHAMRRVLSISMRATITALLEYGLPAADIEALVARVEGALADSVPHVAAGLAFDIAREAREILFSE